MKHVQRSSAARIGAAAVLLAGVGTAAPAHAAPAAGIALDATVFEGSGCPESSDAEADLDGHRLRLRYERLAARAGDGGGASQRANCVANLKLTVAEGWQYRVDRLWLRGYAALDEDVEGQATATYYFAGSPATGETTAELTGPYDDEFSRSGGGDGAWSECGADRALNINASVFVETEGTGGAGELSLGNRRGLTADLKLRRC
ncbi:hypothetical protein GCM10010124_30290 [Pilimelia terevasa]|uniref:DUF4360 domain-containing protein n=1 Tax=Pilimelia terevasa TaxID=53372 RepID=A0A8J3FLL8_9ACTN|nr:DUF4360 domain-containing protein [Pilimelia terevasa]GGK35545.1 hypothetical protein GCM10010124_30290 [Pilimelia terevasa]